MTNTKFNFNGDNLIYVVSTKPGGVDGLDASDPGRPVWMFLTEDEAKKKVGPDTRYSIEAKVVDAREIRLGLLKKLSLEERLYLKVLGVNLLR